MAASDTTYAYTAKITVGAHDRGCSAVLVDPEWLLTAASCFAEDPAASLAVPAGVPAKATTAVVGRSDLTGTQGAERRVVELVPRTDRDVVLARLSRPVTTVTPATFAGGAPAAGAELTFAGYGRTKTVWAPNQLHTGVYTVDSTAAASVNVTGKGGVAACMGDAGGPVLSGGTLVGLTSRSSQGGCLGTDETQTSTAGVVARVDDLAAWVAQKAGATRITDFNGDAVEDIAVGDPMATVGGDTTAGLVRVVYGGGKGTAEITQDLDWVAAAPSPATTSATISRPSTTTRTATPISWCPRRRRTSAPRPTPASSTSCSAAGTVSAPVRPRATSSRAPAPAPSAPPRPRATTGWAPPSRRAPPPRAGRGS